VHVILHNGALACFLMFAGKTDFVVRSEAFSALCSELACRLAAVRTENVENSFSQSSTLKDGLRRGYRIVVGMGDELRKQARRCGEAVLPELKF